MKSMLLFLAIPKVGRYTQWVALHQKMLENFCLFVNVSFYQKFGAIEKLCRYIKRLEAMVLRMYEKFEGIEKRCRNLWNVCQYMTTYSVHLKLVAICKVCWYIKSGVLWFIFYVKSFIALWKGSRHKKSLSLHEMFVTMVLCLTE